MKNLKYLLFSLIFTINFACVINEKIEDKEFNKIPDKITQEKVIGDYIIHSSSIDKFDKIEKIDEFILSIKTDLTFTIKNAPVKLVNGKYYFEKSDSLVLEMNGEWNLIYNKQNSDNTLNLTIEKREKNSYYKSFIAYKVLKSDKGLILSNLIPVNDGKFEYMRFVKKD
ncbi:hypothetical protein [uncultured Lutibacter sp.]|uniref:hypothetical protein n=1 Tax=uncultured Lutibacter sp. TaxID=437739 RepID=UPI00262D0CE6|nr:hypothetical protein [uncultured Lutibacter sp.]